MPWHVTEWDGRVCQGPEGNSHCIEYENIARAKDVDVETTYRGKSFADFVTPSDLPPSASESGGFMSPKEWTCSHRHPYKNWLEETHGHLEETSRQVAPYTALAVPFRWLDRTNLEDFTQPQILNPLPADSWPDVYTSKWVFQPHVQRAVLDGFFAPLLPGDSLVMFYTKYRQPFFEDVHRLIIGIGEVTAVGRGHSYRNTTKPQAPEHPIWERDVALSLRARGEADC